MDTPFTVIFSLVIFVFALIWIFLQIGAYCKIFEKAGESGWKSLVPFYSTYIQYKFTWSTQYFSFYLVSSILLLICKYMGSRSLLALLLSLPAFIVFFGLQVISTHKLSKAFGHGIGFTLGLFFFKPIFILILAFGSSQYQGPQ
ncbi:MAG: hypothetical protein HFG56_04810 [Lachnospiraceae bacterium]|nr:hypothetical protein [Lachnospiraceae bacterium]